jgi:putative DNA primase/helicase
MSARRRLPDQRPSTGAFDAWTQRARSVPIEGEIERRHIKLSGRTERIGPCPRCGGDDRFSINVKKGVWHCRGCGKGGDVIALVQHLDKVEFIAACETLTGEPPPKGNGKDHGVDKAIVVDEFPYPNEGGEIVFVVERVEYRNAAGMMVVNKDGKHKKSFRQKRPDPDRLGYWLWNVDGVMPVPYRLPELIEAIGRDHVVCICEGEKCANALRDIGAVATTNAMGAGKWREELNKYFAGADVVLVPDNDNPGFKHVQNVGAALTGIAKRLRVLMLPGLPAKGDVVDWLAAGGTREALDQLIEQAPEWRPLATEATAADPESKAKAKAMEDELLNALADMRPGIEFARKRKRAAKVLGVSAKSIDDELDARRITKVVPLYGHWIVDPWPEPVDGDSLLRDIIKRIRRHVVCSQEQALTAALWIMFAWVHDEAATHSPILCVTSAEPNSGKTTLLGLISFLMPRCVSSVEISEAALYRSIKLWQPSFCIDEFDSVLSSDDKVGLRSVINSGHTRGQGVVRCIGDDKTPEMFPTFAPKAIGMRGRKLPDTTLSRCVFVEMRRKKTDEQIEKFKHKDDSDLAQLRQRLARWSDDNAETLRDAEPSMAAEFDNRLADNWRLLLAIADLAGDDWGDQARAAAIRLEGASDTSTINVRLLADIRRIFYACYACGGTGKDDITDDDQRCPSCNGSGTAERPLECILSQTLVKRLKADEEAPWTGWNHGKGLTQNTLATLLGGGGGRGRASRGGFGITTETVHPPPPSPHGRGYKRHRFEDAWARYLPVLPSEGGE